MCLGGVSQHISAVEAFLTVSGTLSSNHIAPMDGFLCETVVQAIYPGLAVVICFWLFDARSGALPNARGFLRPILHERGPGYKTSHRLILKYFDNFDCFLVN